MTTMMKPKHRTTKRSRLALAAALLIGACLWLAPSAMADTFGGRAFAAYVNLPALGAGPVTLSDSEALPPAGGWQGQGLPGASIPGAFSATVLNAATSGGSGAASSASSLADLIVLPGLPAELTARFVRAQTDVASNRGWGRSDIDGLTFAGRTIAVTGVPNQRVDLPLVGTLLINEQVSPVSAGQPMIVNALHLRLAGGGEVIVAGAASAVDPLGTVNAANRARTGDLLRRPPAVAVHLQPECYDFVTGGGWFEPRYEGGPPQRVNFGFNAGFRTEGGDLKGHFNLVDHNDGTHIEGVNVDTYFRLGDPQSKCRMFEGDAVMNGVAGFRYHVEVCDYGEPGRDDRIRVLLYTPAGTEVYFADDYTSGKTCAPDEPRCGDLDGGNIQLHKPCDPQPASAARPDASLSGKA